MAAEPRSASLIRSHCATNTAKVRYDSRRTHRSIASAAANDAAVPHSLLRTGKAKAVIAMRVAKSAIDAVTRRH